MVSTTALIVHFFLKPHLRALAETCDVTLALNPENDAYTPPLSLPVSFTSIDIKRPIAPYHDFLALFQLFRLFRRKRVDLVWTVAPKAGLLGMVAALLAGVPARVFIFQGEVWASRRGLLRWLLKTADRVTAACATHILAVSESERVFLEAEGVVPQGRVKVFGAGSIGGVDLDRFRPNPEARAVVRAELSIPQDATLALFVGRLTADKGIFELAEVFGKIASDQPDLWLLWVGPDEEKAASKIKSLMGCGAVRSRFVGFTGSPERYMAASDFICLPSRREGFAMVIVEAAATGLPAIGSRIYGISDTVADEKTGLLYDGGDSRQLAEAIIRLASDTKFRMHLAAAARARAVEHFSQSEVVGRYRDFLCGLASLAARTTQD